MNVFKFIDGFLIYNKIKNIDFINQNMTLDVNFLFKFYNSKI